MSKVVYIYLCGCGCVCVSDAKVYFSVYTLTNAILY